MMKTLPPGRAALVVFFLAAGCVNLDEPWLNGNCGDRPSGCRKSDAGSDTRGQVSIGGASGTGGSTNGNASGALPTGEWGGAVDTSSTGGTGGIGGAPSSEASGTGGASPTSQASALSGASGTGGSVPTSGGQGQGGSTPVFTGRADASPTDDVGAFADLPRIDPPSGADDAKAEPADAGSPTHDASAGVAPLPAEKSDAGSGMADGRDSFVPDTAPATNTTVFRDGYGIGLLTGQGWVSLGSLDTLTSPTCGPALITSARPCSGTTTWSSSTALCISGSIPALPSSPNASDYANNWGIQLGIDANLTGEPIGKQFRTVTYNMTGSPSSGLRAEIHRSGDALTVTYCATLVPGQPIALTSFNSSCWDGTGVSLTSADTKKIDKVIVHIPSSGSSIGVNDLCMGSIIFAP